MWTAYFRFQSVFTVGKAHFGKASFCLLSVKSGKTFALLLTTTKSSCDTCFSVELCGPTGIVEREEDVSDVRLSIHTSPLLCCCSREKDLPTFLCTACSHSRKVTVPARDCPSNLGSARHRNLWIFCFSLFSLQEFYVQDGGNECPASSMPILLEVNELVQEQATCDCRAS